MRKLFEIDGKDKAYCAIKNETHPRFKDAKRFIEELWEKVHCYLDPDLATNLPYEFHQHFWEIYLAASLMDAGLKLENRKSSEGPDICISANEKHRIWIEAVIAQPGEGADAVKKTEPYKVIDVPDEQIKLRLTNAFDSKVKQYKKRLKTKQIDSEDPYLIAVNAAKVPSARNEREIPRIVRSLLPFGNKILHFDKKTFKKVDVSHEYQSEIVKLNGEGIRTTSFLDPDYSGISAVIYSCVDILNHPVKLNDAILLFHNPLASNPLPLGFLENGYEYWVDLQLKSKNWVYKK